MFYSSIFPGHGAFNMLIRKYSKVYKVFVVSLIWVKIVCGVDSQSCSIKRTVTTVNCTICEYEEQCICRVIKLADTSFTELCKRKNRKTGTKQLKPFTCKLGGLNKQPLYIMMYAYGMDNTVIEVAMYKKCIFPSIIEHRKRYLELKGSRFRLVLPSESASPQSSTSPLNPEAKVLSERCDSAGIVANAADKQHDCNDWALLLQDGEYCQTLLMSLLSLAKEERIYLGKYAADCSETQSANNVGDMEKELKKLLESRQFKMADAPRCKSRAWCELRQILLQHITSKEAFKRIWKFLMFIDNFLQESFCAQSIVRVFDSTGIVPFNPQRILSKNQQYSELSHEQAQLILNKVNELSIVFERKDMVPEDEFDRVLGDLDNHLPTSDKLLTSKTTQQQGTILFDGALKSSLEKNTSVRSKRKIKGDIVITEKLKRVKKVLP